MTIQILKDAAVIIGFLAVLAYMQVNDAKDQSHVVSELEKIVTKCTNRGDNYIVVEGEYYICGATPTGIKAKEI